MKRLLENDDIVGSRDVDNSRKSMTGIPGARLFLGSGLLTQDRWPALCFVFARELLDEASANSYCSPGR